MKPEDLLNRVSDRDSFIAFVEALADERRRAAEIERENSDVYVCDGAHGWMNADIPQFLEASLGFFADDPADDPPEAKEPSWRTFAEILYCGKIIE